MKSLTLFILLFSQGVVVFANQTALAHKELVGLRTKKYLSSVDRESVIYKVVEKHRATIKANPFDQETMNALVMALSMAQETDQDLYAAELALEFESANPLGFKKALAGLSQNTRTKFQAAMTSVKEE